MVQRLIRIGGARNGLHQHRQNGDELMALVRITGHGLEITIRLFDVRHSVGRQDASYLLGIAFRRQQQRCGIRLSNRRLHQKPPRLR